MIEPLEYKPIIQKLLEKTKAGRVPWEEHEWDRFRCTLDEYTFFVWKTDDGYALSMEDMHHKRVFLAKAEEEIIFTQRDKEEMFELLSDLYELARRKALNIPEKLAGVSELLDNI
jgi:hypothetical protein